MPPFQYGHDQDDSFFPGPPTVPQPPLHVRSGTPVDESLLLEEISQFMAVERLRSPEELVPLQPPDVLRPLVANTIHGLEDARAGIDSPSALASHEVPAVSILDAQPAIVAGDASHHAPNADTDEHEREAAFRSHEGLHYNGDARPLDSTSGLQHPVPATCYHPQPLTLKDSNGSRLCIRTTGRNDLSLLSPLERSFHNDDGRFDPYAGRKQQFESTTSPPTPFQVPCGFLGCLETFTTLDTAVRHMWGDDLVSFGHCADWDESRIPMCPMHMEHEICDLSRKLSSQRSNMPRKRTRPSDVSDNEFHLHFRLHILAGHGIICTCGATFPTIYHAYRHVLPQKRKKENILCKRVARHSSMPTDHCPSLASFASDLRNSCSNRIFLSHKNLGIASCIDQPTT